MVVDATLVRHHPGAYHAVLAGQSPAERQRTEGALAGLRFVRNRLGSQAHPAAFIHAAATAPGARSGPITGWRWKPVPLSVLASLPPPAQAWEKTRHHAYQAQLAGRTIGETFRRATTFLTLTAANAAAVADLANADAHPQSAPP